MKNALYKYTYFYVYLYMYVQIVYDVLLLTYLLHAKPTIIIQKNMRTISLTVVTDLKDCSRSLRSCSPNS